jgi:hypothetical protein
MMTLDYIKVAAAVDYIKLAATARHIQETVFNRAADSDIKLTADTVKVVMEASIELAFIAHRGDANV